MSVPFFYEPSILLNAAHHTLSEESSKHCVQVLRMKQGDELQITNGSGFLGKAHILEGDKKHTTISVEHIEIVPPAEKKICLAISLLKNTARFEWLLEKVTEMGVTAIHPLICNRTEHTRFRMERMQGILVSAALQSQQAWLPKLWPPTPFHEYLTGDSYTQKLIAHCENDEKIFISDLPSFTETSILIGPEGDFTREEIGAAIAKNYQPVSLGSTRLRTETAGMLATALLANR
ncbi:MAG: hypothetical protein RLZZ28_1121 [Bacteroidota bacterium]|jgi:16S rRNA (uracil1498-N3)-methyltransferase